MHTVEDLKLAVIGFGSQGHAHALNLKDSGCDVTIGLYAKSKSRAVAKKLGFKVMDTADAVKHADVIFIAVPDTVIPSVWEKDILPNLTKGKTALFSHGLAVHFELIEVPEGVDVIMVAPKGPGHTVRSQFVEGKDLPEADPVDGDWCPAKLVGRWTPHLAEFRQFCAISFQMFCENFDQIFKQIRKRLSLFEQRIRK